MDVWMHQAHQRSNPSRTNPPLQVPARQRNLYVHAAVEGMDGGKRSYETVRLGLGGPYLPFGGPFGGPGRLVVSVGQSISCLRHVLLCLELAENGQPFIVKAQLADPAVS